jgi:DNA-binding IclR family transcriptional regulator
VALGVLWRDQVSYLYHAAPGTPPDQALGRAGLFEASRSSIGRVLLAQLDEESLTGTYGDRPIPGFTGGLRAFGRDLAAVRRQGFAKVALGGGRFTLGVPVGAVAGLAFADVRSDDNLDDLIGELRVRARRIARTLNGGI